MTTPVPAATFTGPAPAENLTPDRSLGQRRLREPARQHVDQPRGGMRLGGRLASAMRAL
jgi:hypothetical protein